MMSCFRPQASMADAWHSHAIHHCPLYTPQTTKSFSSTCMLQTNSCRLFNMRVCALLFFRWRTTMNRRYGTGEKGETLPTTRLTCSMAMPLTSSQFVFLLHRNNHKNNPHTRSPPIAYPCPSSARPCHPPRIHQAVVRCSSPSSLLTSPSHPPSR